MSDMSIDTSSCWNCLLHTTRQRRHKGRSTGNTLHRFAKMAPVSKNAPYCRALHQQCLTCSVNILSIAGIALLLLGRRLLRINTPMADVSQSIFSAFFVFGSCTTPAHSATSKLCTFARSFRSRNGKSLRCTSSAVCRGTSRIAQQMRLSLAQIWDRHDARRIPVRQAAEVH